MLRHQDARRRMSQAGHQALSLSLPSRQIPKVKRASLFGTGKRIEMTDMAGGLVLHLPESTRDPIDTIVVLETSR